MEGAAKGKINKRRTRRDTATTTSRPVDMIHHNYNPYPTFRLTLASASGGA